MSSVKLNSWCTDMPEIKLRRIRVGLEIHGEMQFYEGLNIQASGTKYTNPLQNECEVTISGLNPETRNYLLTQTSPFEKRDKAARLTLEVGREGGDLFLLYQGDITEAEISMPPDLSLTLKAKTNNGNNARVVVSQGKDRVKLSALVAEVARNNGVEPQFEATDKWIGGYSYTGTASGQVRDLQKSGSVSAFVDDGKLIVKDSDKALEGRRRVLNEKSGMVGLPRAKDQGVEVTYLVDGESLLGGQLTIESEINPALSGDYVIDQLKFDVRTHSDEFFYIAKCRRLNG